MNKEFIKNMLEIEVKNLFGKYAKANTGVFISHRIGHKQDTAGIALFICQKTWRLL